MAEKSVFEVTVRTDPPLAGRLSANVYEGEELSNHIIRLDREWSVRVHWELTGALVPCICGNWCLTLFLESIGPGPELHFPDTSLGDYEISIPLDPCGDGRYWYEIKVPKGRIREEHCSIPYKPVVALTYENCDKPGPMAGFCELPILQFYRDEKQHPPH